MGLYKVLTDSNVPQILECGRTAANFIHVTDTNGRRLMLNVRSIVSVEENGTSAPSDTIDDLHALAYDLESCPGIASDEEIDQIYEMAQKLRDLNKRLTEELKRYGLKVN